MRSSPVVERGCTAPLAAPFADPSAGSPAGAPAGVFAAARLAPVLLGVALLGACGGGPAPRLYVLEPPPDTSLDAVANEIEDVLRRGSPRAAAAEEVFGPLGTAVVTLPGYARDPRIASRDAGTGVSFDDDDRWAESPEEAITRVLVERLRHHGGDAVLLEPFPRGFEPAARVEIAFDRLLREPGGGVDAGGRILLLSGDGRGLVDVLPFRLSRAGASTAPPAFFAAVSAMIDELARLALARLRGDAPA